MLDGNLEGKRPQLSLFESTSVESREASATEASVLFSSSDRARIHRILRFNDEDGFTLIDARNESDQKPFLISGYASQVWPGQSFTSESNYFSFGEPLTPRALKKFLKAGPFGRLGKKTTELLSKSLAGRFFTTFENSPEDLLKISGIGKKRMNELVSRYADFRAKREIADFLFREKLPLHWGASLWRLYGANAIEEFSKAPYDAVVQQDLAFKLADRFALSHGFALESSVRIRVGLLDILHSHSLQGHCATPDDDLVLEAVARLGVSQDVVEETLELSLINGELISEAIEGRDCVYTKQIWKLERDVAERLLEFSEIAPTHHFLDPVKSVAWAQRFLEIKLSPKQREAVEATLNSKLAIITGGPGTGKTTLVRCLVTILNSQYSRFALCAPTGRAAQRLRETTGATATTIHRLLRYDGVRNTFQHDRRQPLNLDFVLVDEASMLDLSLMSHLLEALPESCALVLVGDAHQLPSVGAGTVLQSLISSKRFPVVELTDTFRQSADSGIRLNADRIHKGLMPVNGAALKNDFRYIEVENRDDVDRRLKELLENTLPRHCGVEDLTQVQILTPTNRGELGSQELNERLRALFSPQPGPASDIRQPFRLGDKVIVTKNDYSKSVFNGDIGKVTRIAPDLEMLEIDFGERMAIFHFDELEGLSLAYAISIHKSQGSEYRAVIIILTEEHVSLAQRHLVYTAVTRGKDFVFLLAQPRTLKAAVTRADHRWQKLTELLTRP